MSAENGPKPACTCATLWLEDGSSYSVIPGEAAMEAIRYKFNPSGLKNVERLKTLSSAFIQLCNDIIKEKPESGRELAVAKTEMQTASMWAVLGATKDAPKKD